MYFSRPGSKDKMDVLDLIINTLREHEKNLDKLTERLQNLVETLDSKVEHEKLAKPFPLLEKARLGPPPAVFSLPTVECARWKDFKEKSMKAEVTVFEINERGVVVSCVYAGVVYRSAIAFAHSSDKLKRWLSENLGVPEEKILEGRLTY